MLLELFKTRVFFCEQEKRSCFFQGGKQPIFTTTVFLNYVLNLAVRHFHRLARLLGLQKDQLLWLYFI